MDQISLSDFVKREIENLQKFSLHCPSDIKNETMTFEDWIDQYICFIEMPA